MTSIKFSRQRECIKNYLASTLEHPTADTIYLYVKQQFPNISLGTVYRNLNLLADLGEVSKISIPDSGDRFDGNMDPHYHFFCTNCNCVIDRHIESLDFINGIANNNFTGEIQGHNITFYGHCEDCLKKA